MITSGWHTGRDLGSLENFDLHLHIDNIVIQENNSLKYFKYNYYVSTMTGYLWTANDYTEENWPLRFMLIFLISLYEKR
jgi:hypothetical protein